MQTCLKNINFRTHLSNIIIFVILFPIRVFHYMKTSLRENISQQLQVRFSTMGLVAVNTRYHCRMLLLRVIEGFCSKKWLYPPYQVSLNDIAVDVALLVFRVVAFIRKVPLDTILKSIPRKILHELGFVLFVYYFHGVGIAKLSTYNTQKKN